jgi:3-(3-hydroxy-phenyl)propionate hydroxylase
VPQVLIAGAGPTGLMLAAELALAKVDVAIIERRPTPELSGVRAGGLHARTIELLDQRGVAERFLAKGQPVQATSFAWIPLDLSDFPTRYNYTLGLVQREIERLLAEWVDELEVPVHRGREVTGFTQDESGVDVTTADGKTIRADYLVGCDGGRSVIRKAAGIDFPGWDPTMSCLLAEVQLKDEPTWGLRRDALGVHAFGKMGEAVRVMVGEREVGRRDEPTLRDLRDALVAVYGTDYGVHSPTSISRFTDVTRQAAAYRERRVLLAGDAAHVHSPVGGQGLNLGVHDAVNLGWKLARVVKRASPDALLDTYHRERHPAAARALKHTMAATALLRSDDRIEALRESMAEVLRMHEPRQHFAALLSGLDVRYDLGEGHPLVGRRMPDVDLETARGPQRLFSLLHDAEPFLLNLGEPASFPTKTVEARYDGPWELPVIGKVAAPTAVLIRPDGYVAWVGDREQRGLVEALATWSGLPTTSPPPSGP